MERFNFFVKEGFNRSDTKGRNSRCNQSKSEENNSQYESKSKKNNADLIKPKPKGINTDSNQPKHVKENAADFNNSTFLTDYKEVKFSYTWRIKNIHLCALKCQEFLESPTFSTTFCGEVKWAMRIYPKGRNPVKELHADELCISFFERCNCKDVGLFLHRISENPVKSTFRYRLICERYRSKYDSDADIQKYTYPSQGVELIDMDSTDVTEYGVDDLYLRDKFEGQETLVIKCDIYVTNVFNMEVPNNFGAGVLQSGTLFQNLNEMLETGKFSDVTLQAGDVNIPAHRNILASRSKVFEAMFLHDMKETHTNVVQIKDIEPAVLSNLLQYMYTGRVVDFNIEKAIALYPAADKYFLEELKNWCVDMMLRYMTVENVCRIAQVAHLHPDPNLKEAVLNMFRNHTSEIFRRKEWQHLIGDINYQALVSEILRYVSSEFITNCEDN